MASSQERSNRNPPAKVVSFPNRRIFLYACLTALFDSGRSGVERPAPPFVNEFPDADRIQGGANFHDLDIAIADHGDALALGSLVYKIVVKFNRSFHFPHPFRRLLR